MEPYVTLAIALRATPGAYAVLLGAGVSAASGIPHAWDVQRDLIERVAAAEQVEGIGDPHAWYRDRFNQEATYDSLLEALTNTQFERQALLRSYFEPDEQEREEGRKVPAAAHHAVARLVAAGLVRIVLTTNFDRLMETALRDAGIEPTVAAHTDDIVGLAPPHTLTGLVVHLHGDYLNPTSMRNTPAELQAYPQQVDEFLDRVFDEYGLVIAGWSAKYDPALCNALSRCATRRFATYWADPAPLSDEARALLTRRSAIYVQADADTYFGQVADATDALAETSRQHPASIAVAVASAKRALAGHRQAISLHDTLRREFARIASLPLRSGLWEPDEHETEDDEYERRLRTLEAEAELLLALVATAAYWGRDETDRWWIRDIEQLATPASSGGTVSLLNLKRAPATMVIYAAGIAALAAERWQTLVHILTEPQAVNPSNAEVKPVAAMLGPSVTLRLGNGGERLHQQLCPILTEHLTLSESAYIEAWERFEYLRLISQRSIGPKVDNLYLRRREGQDSYQRMPADWLQRELDRHGKDHPLLRAGFLDGAHDKLTATKQVLDAELAATATWSRADPL
ncbi:SIR2 family protein [Streptomyces sp. NPDC050315]|uniref:SIR2 family protein n=1 Tax=Streptomyces sp. NPDC050315 TaxID=3155039 RepID=UPI00341982F6